VPHEEVAPLDGQSIGTLSKPVYWERAGASRSNTKDDPRSSIRGFLPQGVSAFEARCINNQVQRLVRPLEGLAGLRDIFTDRAALLMEITNWDALQSVSPLCDDVVALSPKWALVRTGIRSEQWVETLSNLMRNNPYDCILRIQWRQSYHGGRPWALPSATTQQIQAVRVQARAKLSSRGGKIDRPLESSITVEGNLGPDPAGLVRIMMGNIQTKLASPLQEVIEGSELRIGQWLMCLHPPTQEPTGRIKVMVANSSAAKELEKAAHNQVVNVGGDALAVKVCNFQTMALPRCQGNELGAPTALPGRPPGL